MEIGARDPVIVIEPRLSIAPETLDPVEMDPFPDIFVPFVGDSLVLPPQLQGHISMVIISVVDAPPPPLSMPLDQGLEGLPFAIGHGEGDHPTIPLVDPEDDMLAMGSPTSLPLPLTPKHRLVHLQFPCQAQGLRLLQGTVVDCLSKQPEGPLDRGQADGYIPADPVSRYPRDEEVKRMDYYIQRDAQSAQIGAGELPELVATGGALEPVGTQPVELMLATPWAGPPPTTLAEPVEEALGSCQARSQMQGSMGLHILSLPWSQLLRYYLIKN